MTPIDRLRLEFDEAWPAGCRIHSLNGNKMFAGLVRQFDQGSEAEPHQDIIAWDAPELADAQAIRRQLAMNVYLSIPTKGGELVLWDRELSKCEYELYRNPGSYGVDREMLGEPVEVLVPEQGELIVFNSQNVHAVNCISGSSRVSWSCFAGEVERDAPLVMWS